jgi:hypothetical protein
LQRDIAVGQREVLDFAGLLRTLSACSPRVEASGADRSRGNCSGFGALVGGALGLSSAAWPGAADLAARAVLSLAALTSPEAAPPELRVLDTRALSLSPLAESACLAPVEVAPLASIGERTHDDEASRLESR